MTATVHRHTQPGTSGLLAEAAVCLDAHRSVLRELLAEVEALHADVIDGCSLRDPATGLPDPTTMEPADTAEAERLAALIRRAEALTGETA